MRITARWFLAVGALLALALGVRVWHHFHGPRLLHPGDRLVPIALSSLSGSPVIFEPDGRPQLINVFATWCPPCRDETPAFSALAKILQTRGVQVVGIDQQESAQQVNRFQQEFSLTYQLYIDTGNVTHVVLGARLIPETIYVGANGVIRWIHEGPLTARDMQTLSRNVESAV